MKQRGLHVSRAASSRDLHAFLDAYNLLGVEYSAQPADIRRAYKAAARTHHPDRHAAGSSEQREATERMAAINAAYELVRDAPLRHHRVSTGSRPDEPWSDEELDRAVRRAKTDRAVSNVINAGCVVVLLILPSFAGFILTGHISRSPKFWAVTVAYVAIALLAFRGGLTPRLWNTFALFRFLARF